MLDVTSAKPSRAISITDQDVEHRKRTVNLEHDDIARIVSLKDIIAPSINHYTEEFFNRLAKTGGAAALFAQSDALDEAKCRKREHLVALLRGRYDRDYVEQRIDLAALYSKHGLEARSFIGAYQQMMQSIGNDVAEKLHNNAATTLQSLMSLTKVGYFDVSIILDALIAERERTIGLQQEAIRELSTPVLQIRDRLLILPIIGVLDSQRAKQLTSDLLQAIRANRSKIVVMDITGVAAVDSKVANHLIQTVAAARLMGSTVIITGLSAEVAQALVALGIDLGKIDTTSDLQAGLEQAESSLGYRMVRAEEAAGPGIANLTSS